VTDWEIFNGTVETKISASIVTVSVDTPDIAAKLVAFVKSFTTILQDTI
jgi:hypothetical protein